MEPSGMSPQYNVWFQNRRAKWRRQEKLDYGKLPEGLTIPTMPKLTTSGSLTSTALPLDPWFTPPIVSLSTVGDVSVSQSTALTSLPASVIRSATGSLSFPDYLPAAMTSRCTNLTSHLHTLSGMFNPLLTRRGLGVVDGAGSRAKSSSIASLRVRAKEHLDIIDRHLESSGYE